MMTVEQMMGAHKANVETLFGLTSKAFEGMEKLMELNMQVAKTAMGEAAQTAPHAHFYQPWPRADGNWRE